MLVTTLFSVCPGAIFTSKATNPDSFCRIVANVKLTRFAEVSYVPVKPLNTNGPDGALKLASLFWGGADSRNDPGT